MHQIAFALPKRLFSENRFVHHIFRPVCVAPVKQTETPFRVAAMAEPLAEKKIPPREPVDIFIWAGGKQLLDGACQFIAQPLFGVKAQDPVMGGLFDTVLLLFSETQSLLVHYFRAEFSRNAGGAIIAA